MLCSPCGWPRVVCSWRTRHCCLTWARAACSVHAGAPVPLSPAPCALRRHRAPPCTAIYSNYLARCAGRRDAGRHPATAPAGATSSTARSSPRTRACPTPTAWCRRTTRAPPRSTCCAALPPVRPWTPPAASSPAHMEPGAATPAGSAARPHRASVPNRSAGVRPLPQACQRRGRLAAGAPAASQRAGGRRCGCLPLLTCGRAARRRVRGPEARHEVEPGLHGQVGRGQGLHGRRQARGRGDPGARAAAATGEGFILGRAAGRRAVSGSALLGRPVQGLASQAPRRRAAARASLPGVPPR
jgi:hypothetical protein